MATVEIIRALVGLLICAAAVTVIALIFAGILWHSLVKKSDFSNMEITEWEE